MTSLGRIRAKSSGVYLSDVSDKLLKKYAYDPKFFISKSGLGKEFIRAEAIIVRDITAALQSHPTFRNHFAVVTTPFEDGSRHGFNVEVVAIDEVGMYILNGTKPHRIYAKNASVLRFIWYPDQEQQDISIVPGSKFKMPERDSGPGIEMFRSEVYVSGIESRREELIVVLGTIIQERANRIFKSGKSGAKK